MERVRNGGGIDPKRDCDFIRSPPSSQSLPPAQRITAEPASTASARTARSSASPTQTGSPPTCRGVAASRPRHSRVAHRSAERRLPRRQFHAVEGLLKTSFSLRANRGRAWRCLLSEKWGGGRGGARLVPRPQTQRNLAAGVGPLGPQAPSMVRDHPLSDEKARPDEDRNRTVYGVTRDFAPAGTRIVRSMTLAAMTGKEKSSLLGSRLVALRHRSFDRGLPRSFESCSRKSDEPKWRNGRRAGLKIRSL
jgi:hypothetical protein